MERRFKGIEMEHIPRMQNLTEDELSKIVVKGEPIPPRDFV
jgi:hypothetical protein